MRHSAIIWMVSGLLSLGAHAGLMSALAKISIQAPKDEGLADVILAGDGFSAVAASSTAASSAAELAAPDAGAELVAAASAGEAAAASESAAAAAADSAAVEPAPAESAASAPESTSSAAAAAENVNSAVALPSTANDVAPSDTSGIAVAPPDTGTVQPQAPSENGSVAQVSPATAAQENNGAPAAAAGTEAVAAEPAGAELKAAAAPEVTSPPPAKATEQGGGAATLSAGTKIAAIATAVVSQAERIDRFLTSYRGGDCLYAAPRDLESPRPAFAGFGVEKGVTDFAAAFKQAVGIEPRMAIREVMEAQCAAVDFLREVDAAKLKRVRLVLDNETIRDGGAITGHLEGNPQGEVRLLVIGDDGAVNDISSDFHRTAGTNLFFSPAVVNAEGRARNQIMVVLVSAEPLAISVTHQPGEAAALFKDIAAQVKGQGARVSLGFGAFQVK